MHTGHDASFKIVDAHCLLMCRLDRGYHNTFCVLHHLPDKLAATVQHARNQWQTDEPVP